MGRLVIDGDNVYELDEECIREKRKEKEKEKEKKSSKTEENK